MTQAEVMRQVTAERDMLRDRLLQHTQPLARSSTTSTDWIAAAYGTNSRPAQSLSGEQPPLILSHIEVSLKLSKSQVDAMVRPFCTTWIGTLLLAWKAVCNCTQLSQLDCHGTIQEHDVLHELLCGVSKETSACHIMVSISVIMLTASDTGCHHYVINSHAHAEQGMCNDALVLQRCGLPRQLCLPPTVRQCSFAPSGDMRSAT